MVRRYRQSTRAVFMAAPGGSESGCKGGGGKAWAGAPVWVDPKAGCTRRGPVRAGLLARNSTVIEKHSYFVCKVLLALAQGCNRPMRVESERAAWCRRKKRARRPVPWHGGWPRAPKGINRLSRHPPFGTGGSSADPPFRSDQSGFPESRCALRCRPESFAAGRARHSRARFRSGPCLP